MFFFSRIALSEKEPKNVTDIPLWINSKKRYVPYCSCSSNGTPQTNLVIVNVYFKGLSRLNTAPIPIVLRADIRSQTEPSFISKYCKLWVKNTAMHCLQKPVTKIRPCLAIASAVAWTCIILCSSIHNYSVTLDAVVVETCVYWGNPVRDLRDLLQDLYD
jgi:hypothetical protein